MVASVQGIVEGCHLSKSSTMLIGFSFTGKPLLILALESFFAEPSIGILTSLYDSINLLDTSSMPKLCPYEKQILRGTMTEAAIGVKSKDDHYWKTKVIYDRIPIPVRVPLAVYHDEIGDVSLNHIPSMPLQMT